MSSACPFCDAGHLVERSGTYTHEWPEDFPTRTSVFEDALWLECDECGEQILPAALLRRIEAKRYRIEGLLTPAEIRRTRERLGYSQVEMARLIGVGDKSYSRWESGRSVQTKSMDNLVRIAAICPYLFHQIEAARTAGTTVGPYTFGLLSPARVENALVVASPASALEATYYTSWSSPASIAWGSEIPASEPDEEMADSESEAA